MKMDGYELLVGDGVYDVVFGPGKVDRVTEAEDRFWVIIGKRNECYDSKGNGRFGCRTLYWRDPVIVPPHKDDAAWAQTSKVIKAVSAILGGK